ncbi:hypothetical protein PLEI_0033 [Photobacterium leiognathi lrivu.4.1]|uniref:Uncharacterized protein n=1 Tax=Photobacterium leiognathi lrivu.4.1 TaxID=1248232 RepID=V5EM48_PHOLE|nr:hypothetical protein [Photobacterium leiognathi]GAD28394.1 hypothetical protein PLEI_0033 [Photobacterium leiognathi lrivu.4.1]
MTKIMLELPVGNTNITDLFNFSPALVADLKKILVSERYKGGKGHNLRSISARFRVVLTACRFIIANESNADVLKQGFSAFVEDNYAFLKSIYSSDIRRELRNELLIAVGIFIGSPLLKHHYQSDLWAFYFDVQDAWRHIDSEDLKETLPKVHTEMTALHASEIELLAQKSYSIETLHTRFTKAKRLLRERLAPDFKAEFEQYGLQALSFNNHRIQKALFQCIQNDVQQKKISLRTGTGYFEIVRWLMEVTGQEVVDAYRISMQRYQAHAKRESLEKTYSDEELIELVFHLEKAIEQAQDNKQQVTLYFAKIQLKTCWNTAPMCAIDLSDIKEIELPTSKKTMTIMLQKARKGYDIDTYHLDGRTVNSVMQDLLQVKALTERYREADSPFQSLLFIYEEYGEIGCIKGTNATAYINALLEAQGCSVRYNSQRIRKSGANHIYREVAKDLRKYKQRMRHSYSTFIQHYKQVEEADTQTNLSDAVQTMQSYFTGREISTDIIIIDKDDTELQQTPTGLCASKSKDIEAQQYHKEHRLLHQKNGHEATWCSDYLACIWCKYFRTVADPDHVWQLLSYRDYVLADMRASVSNLEGNEQQKEAMEVLKNRVNDILRQLGIRNPQAVEQAKEMQRIQGMHPFWSFAISAVTV